MIYMNHVDHRGTNNPGASCAQEHDNPKNHNMSWAYDHVKNCNHDDYYVFFAHSLSLMV